MEAAGKRSRSYRAKGTALVAYGAMLLMGPASELVRGQSMLPATATRGSGPAAVALPQTPAVAAARPAVAALPVPRMLPAVATYPGSDMAPPARFLTTAPAPARAFLPHSSAVQPAAWVAQRRTAGGTTAAALEALAADTDLTRLPAVDATTDTLPEPPQPPAETTKASPEEEAKRMVVGSDAKMTASWKNGLEIQSADKSFRVHVGGRTQFDGVFLQGEPGVEAGLGAFATQDSVNFRRARLRVDGTMYEVIEWAAEFDFVNSLNDNGGLVGGLPNQPASAANVIHATAPTDLWFTVTHLPAVGNMRLGNYKEPIGMEHLTSSRYLDFLERSFNQDAFTGPFNNGFSPGVGFFHWTRNERATWNLGLFRNTTNIFAYGIGDGETALTGRVSCLPFYDLPAEGRRLLHVGAAFSIRDPDDEQQRIRSRASLRNGPGALNPVYADTGTFFSTRQNLAGAETAMNLGPLTIQSEYLASWNSNARRVAGGANLGTFFAHGYYVQATYFLTGEHREYERKNGVFARVTPLENFFWVPGQGRSLRGSGAWQLAARFAKLDLRDAGIDGGVIQDAVLGLNWFLNPNMKLQWNYVATFRDAPAALGPAADGWTHGFGMRLAHDF